MSVAPNRNTGATSCAESQAQKPELTADELIAQQSAGVGSILDALGVTSCKSALIAGVSIFPPYIAGGQGSIGCEQIALLAAQMDSNQKIFQCALYSVTQQTSTNASQTLEIAVSYSAGTQIIGCRQEIVQKSNLRVIRYNQMTNDVKQSLNATVKNAMDGFIKSVQDQTAKGLFPAAQGQKVVETMTQNLNQNLDERAITQIIQEQIDTFSNTGKITIEMTGTRVLGNVNQNPDRPCITITQDFVMQVLSQNVMTNSLTQLLAGDARGEMKLLLENAQTQTAEGFSFPDIGGTAIIIAIIIVAMALLFSRRSGGENGQSEPVLAGKVGTIFGSILMVLGIGLIITGVILKLRKSVNSILCYIMMAGGAILFVVGLVMLLKARSQNLRFQQNLAVAKAGAKK